MIREGIPRKYTRLLANVDDWLLVHAEEGEMLCKRIALFYGKPEADGAATRLLAIAQRHVELGLFFCVFPPEPRVDGEDIHWCVKVEGIGFRKPNNYYGDCLCEAVLRAFDGEILGHAKRWCP